MNLSKSGEYLESIFKYLGTFGSVGNLLEVGTTWKVFLWCS
jgi:hypothetical protein